MDQGNPIGHLEPIDAIKLVHFWLQAGEEKWFHGGEEFDEQCRQFEALWNDMQLNRLDSWMNTVTGSVALILLADQIPRNIFRGDAKQFTSDNYGRRVAKHACMKGFDLVTALPLRNFIYMPYMHSEDMEDQLLCCEKMRQFGGETNYHFALIHMDAIARFGRFPHRNKILGRQTSAEERIYLKTGGFGG